jgi:phosphoribosylamine--glycine ligase
MRDMNILLLGGGGREHALAWKLAQSPRLDTLYAAPGNPGIAQHATLVDLDATDHRTVLDFCTRHSIGLVVIGPEAPLVDGLADNLRTMGVPVFGPNKKAAQLEGSKGFTKDLCQRANIPTAAYVRVTSKDGAIAALDDFTLPVVIKADGLAAGKGVIIAETRDEALEALDTMFSGAFGAAGEEVVLEEFMTGEEASFFALTDGTAILSFGSAQDHKRVGDGDTGPNTGGMGAYSPALVLTPALEAQVIETIIKPTVATMAAEGMPYSGVLYAGLMLTDQGPKLVEYNARFGDPECQVLMLRLADDILPWLDAAARGELSRLSGPAWRVEAAVCVVMAAEGYPDAPVTGSPIRGAGSDFGGEAVVFHAGTMLDAEGTLRSSGGRVLNVCALGATLHEARDLAYAAVGAIDFPGGFYRSDIGWRAL